MLNKALSIIKNGKPNYSALKNFNYIHYMKKYYIISYCFIQFYVFSKEDYGFINVYEKNDCATRQIYTVYIIYNTL